jgi:hypothetical protein
MYFLTASTHTLFDVDQHERMTKRIEERRQSTLKERRGQ